MLKEGKVKKGSEILKGALKERYQNLKDNVRQRNVYICIINYCHNNKQEKKWWQKVVRFYIILVYVFKYKLETKINTFTNKSIMPLKRKANVRAGQRLAGPLVSYIVVDFEEKYLTVIKVTETISIYQYVKPPNLQLSKLIHIINTLKIILCSLNTMAKLKAYSDEKLIELVKMHPALYDREQEDYKDAQMKEIIWKTIGESIGKTVGFSYEELYLKVACIILNKSKKGEYKITQIKDSEIIGECKKRWKDIRDNYFRNKRKELLKSEDPTASCIDSLHAESGRSQDTHASQHSVQSHSLNKAASYYKVVEGINKNRMTERMGILRNMAREEEDDVDLFFKSVAITVKRFPPHLIGTAKLKVLTINSVVLKDLVTCWLPLPNSKPAQPS
uniref:MADF domain-containing protein n=1 Tax=Timema genevievae TaxID=629358 RepID=A0A7R9PN60_TIMGE|nr:unnamed protein product [Timema genevievae]